jgi:drug/metabolite transporter (DMT)-like permease
LVGGAILAQVDFHNMKLGRGEWETLLGSLMFTGQILWLERPIFARNRVSHLSLAMFLGSALIPLPFVIGGMNSFAEARLAFSVPSTWVLMLILVIICTVGAYGMMNYWQPFVPASEAGLIYTAEPVFASLYALFLPRWLSAMAEIDYANEKLTPHLVLGGGLITVANILVQVKSAQARTEAYEKPI